MELDRVAVAAEQTTRWPGRVRELAALWRLEMDPRERDAVLEELWKLLNLALHRYVRFQARRFGWLGSADVVDIAADKALELLTRLDRLGWDPSTGSDAQICSFLAAVARNGVIDLVRQRSMEVHATATASWAEAREVPPDLESSVDGSRYAQAIVACAGRLTARARLAWFLRVFCGLQATQIARHPQILTSKGGVYLMLNRSRRQIRKCVKSKGLEPGRMPAGTFAALWELIDEERRARIARSGQEVEA